MQNQEPTGCFNAPEIAEHCTVWERADPTIGLKSFTSRWTCLEQHLKSVEMNNSKAKFLVSCSVSYTLRAFFPVILLLSTPAPNKHKHPHS